MPKSLKGRIPCRLEHASHTGVSRVIQVGLSAILGSEQLFLHRNRVTQESCGATICTTQRNMWQTTTALYRIVENFRGRKFRDFAENQAFRGINFVICVWIVRVCV